MTESHNNSAAPDAPKTCRLCSSANFASVIDLGKSPLCESFLSTDELGQGEMFYPLHLFVCENCFLVQLKEFVSGKEIFAEEYSYFSSFSDSWMQHCREFADQICQQLVLSVDSHVVEIASNDGYMLRNFVEKGISCLGIEPAQKVADAAINIGVPTEVAYFGVDLATKIAKQPDLILAYNVLAHVPDLNDFVGGMKLLLKQSGVIVIEVPHLLSLIQGNQFDTIYHEHFSYFSLAAMTRLFNQHGLHIFKVDKLTTHGGSIRVYAQHQNGRFHELPCVEQIINLETHAGLTDPIIYRRFEQEAIQTKRDLLRLLMKLRIENRSVVGYGAPGKGNTLLNYCGIRSDLIEYVVDRNPHKHGKYLPGSQIPIHSDARLAETKPDYIVILPWNLSDEIIEQLQYTREWGAQFIIPIPDPQVI